MDNEAEGNCIPAAHGEGSEVEDCQRNARSIQGCPRPPKAAKDRQLADLEKRLGFPAFPPSPPKGAHTYPPPQLLHRLNEEHRDQPFNHGCRLGRGAS